MNGIDKEITTSNESQSCEKAGSADSTTAMRNYPEVQLKHGVIDVHTFERWLHDTQKSVVYSVRILRQSKDRKRIVSTWKLRRARIIKHTSGPLNAKGTDVAMEELVLAYERLEMS